MSSFIRMSPLIGAAIFTFFSDRVLAEALTQSIQVEISTNNAAIQSQGKIDGLSDKTHKMLDQYRSAIHQRENLKTYNNYLKELLKSQQLEKESLQQQLQDIETTQHEIVPLILRMRESLEQFVQLDIPFLASERQQRIAGLKEMMVRADVSSAEKYRRILEAFQIENDYGKTIEAYRAELELNGVVSSVDFLRLGRVALYYQRLDGSESGYWSREQKKWIVLPSDFRNAIRQGLRIARKETAPDLLVLPVPKVEAAQ